MVKGWSLIGHLSAMTRDGVLLSLVAIFEYRFVPVVCKRSKAPIVFPKHWHFISYRLSL